MFTTITILIFITTITFSFLQIKLSKKPNRIWGIILPFIFLLIGTYATAEFYVQFIPIVTIPLALLVAVFFICNIPAVVFFIIFIKIRHTIQKQIKEKDIKIINLDKKYKKKK